MKENLFDTIQLEPITIKSGAVYATDPCYAKADGAQKLIEVRKGEYKCKVEIADCGDWGKRIATLTISHKDAIMPFFWDDYFTDYVGDAAVDSGQCGFFDKDYYESQITEKNLVTDEWYHKICEITLDKNARYCGTTDGKGVVSESGLGDGLYAIYAAVENNEIVALKLDFLGVLEDDDEDYEDNDD